MKHIELSQPTAAVTCRAWAEIDLGALAHNYNLCARHIHTIKQDAFVMAVIKADAYGHGAAQSVCALYDCGCRHFAVASVQEAIELRLALEGGRTQPTEILVLGQTDPQDAALLAQYDVSQTLLSPEYATLLHQKAKQAGIRLNVHVKIDTGMHRIGYAAFTDAQAKQSVQDVLYLQKECDAFCVRGMFTHLSDADCGDFCLVQWERFCLVMRELESMGARPALCHVSNGPASLRFPEMYLDGVRLGAPLYGVNPPTPDTDDHATGRNLFPADQLLPVMRLKTRIVHLHTVEAGEPVGYGALYRAERPRTVATLSVGYADGFTRAYADACVTVHTATGDYTAQLTGRICMDLCMLDVTDLPCRVGDEVTLFGNDAGSLGRLAAHAGTIAYEIPSLVTARVPRIYNN